MTFSSAKQFIDDYGKKKEILEKFLKNDALSTLYEMAENNSEGSPELFEWTAVVFHGKTFTDDNETRCIDWRYNPDYRDSDDWSGKAVISMDGNFALVLTLWVGCGSCITSYKEELAKCDQVDFDKDQIIEAAKYKIGQYDRHIGELSKKLARETELKKKLQAVETANTLMCVFGLRLDEKSQEKVERWKKELGMEDAEFEDMPHDERQRIFSKAGEEAVENAFAAGVPVCGAEGDRILKYYPDGTKKEIGKLGGN